MHTVKMLMGREWKLVSVAVLLFARLASGQGLTDSFTTFDTSKWTTASYMGFDGFSYIGLPDALTPVSLDGNDMLRMTSVMTDLQRKGFGSVQSFTAPAGSLTIDFKTLAFHDATVPAANQSNIDGLLEIFLINPVDHRYVGISLFGNNFGATDSRLTEFLNSSGGSVSTTTGWQYDTTYRFVLSSDGASTHLSFQNSLGTEIAGQTFSQSFGALGTYDIAVVQQMGTPNGQYYTDVALNNLQFAIVPEPSSLTLCVLTGLGGIAGVTARSRRRS
jgi:hypothetical protein